MFKLECYAKEFLSFSFLSLLHGIVIKVYEITLSRLKIALRC